MVVVEGGSDSVFAGVVGLVVGTENVGDAVGGVVGVGVFVLGPSSAKPAARAAASATLIGMGECTLGVVGVVGGGG